LHPSRAQGRVSEWDVEINALLNLLVRGADRLLNDYDVARIITNVKLQSPLPCGPWGVGNGVGSWVGCTKRCSAPACVIASAGA